ncbi:DNA-directed RNA polymerase subunit delta [Granulicatella adiacens]|uniref:DNA-directed RNA polymerase subunit delta n=1 Tax=Granulicatella TaxID=117563 RepID=UPI0008A1A9B6|nr:MULTISPECIES: DNA-directed RNA polymerase subunit delta [Granulicatella]MCT2159725.1 DNA-directed RNA polymerase subunit delta [Granulicatella adiacens]OFS99512.1 DNA-directed RNA polymerase subunit delta [Granulicatella sp. HMSC31F03]OFT78539.1 DNA-directed RNA polymerase subunit delta [Granulicatella sp. HMSC30F09]UXY41639.1 DNA-directed RNA polymerase subunit delta [Granulicatella adiacens]VTX52290.1 putative DNA-directed RNA polymerase subunit delta [Granulicatella adiacens]
MELKKLDGINKNELSMVEVAHAILEAKNEVLDFNQLLVEIQEYMELSDEALEARMARFYTDLNIDGSFISLGDNRWGLRDWYPIDSIDEEIATSMEDEEVKKPRKKRKKVNAFGTEDDLIDYNDDDPEDEELLDDEDLDSDDLDDDMDVDLDDDDEEDEIDAYRSDLNELGADEDLEDEVSVEEDLIIIDDEDLDSDFDEEEEE